MNGTERARVAANLRWSQPGAREEQSRTLKAAFRRRLEAQVDPDQLMDTDELAKAVANARKAQMARVRAHKN